MSIKRLQNTLQQLNEFGYSDKGMNRLAYSDEEQAALEYLMNEMTKEGMSVHRDAIGNVIARREGANSDLPAVAFGSHIDTVYNGGQYDGSVGVIAGLEVVRMLNDEEVETKHPIELIIFACEESARFGVATIGSKVMTGNIQVEELWTLKDKDNISFEEALKARNLEIHSISQAERPQDSIKVFYELHVEQGKVLEFERKQVGVVSGIAAPTRFEITIRGQAAHSGATPMWLRQDAFLGAAELALEIEKAGYLEEAKGTVATVGYCEVSPGAMNVIPGEVTLQVDIRSIDQPSKDYVVHRMMSKISKIQKNRDLTIDYKELCDEAPVKLEGEIIASLQESCEQLHVSYVEMPSGAGHDAMNMAKRFPTGMIFVPSKDGISHNKDEYTSMEQIMDGLKVLKEEILKTAEVTSLCLARGESK